MMRFGQAKHDERIVQQAFLDAFPNPERIGCPGDDLIRAIARKKIDSDESVRRHMRRCSPCSQDLLTFRHQWRTVKITRFAVLAAAATVLIVFGIYWRQTISHSPSPRSNLIAGNQQPLHLETGTLDFYDSGIRRGTGNEPPELSKPSGVQRESWWLFCQWPACRENTKFRSVTDLTTAKQSNLSALLHPIKRMDEQHCNSI